MKIEIWSDIVCPFCYIGKSYYEQALAQFPHRDSVQTVYKSFELNPNEASSNNERTLETLAKKFGVSIEQAEGMTAQIAEQAKQAGLIFNFEKMLSINTFDAHRLIQFAQSKGNATALVETIFKAYFTDNIDVSDHSALISIAIENGLVEDEVRAVLSADTFTKEVRADESEAQQLGISGVPFFVVNRKYAISGAQPVNVFIETLNKAWSEQQDNGFVQVASNDADSGASCDPDSGCST